MKGKEEEIVRSSDHISVMSDEVLEWLNPQAGAVFVDGTLGLAGHATAIAERLGAGGQLIGIDRDEQALALAKNKLSHCSSMCRLVHSDFRDIDKVLSDAGIEKVDGILLDLGVSSFQLDDPKRGFSFQADGPLDMRMDQTSLTSAFDLINSLSEHELSRILKDYGQERWHYRIAKCLVRERSQKPIETTQGLSQIVLKALPRCRSRQKIHPATRTFQAFRIAVNRELEALDLAIDKCVNALNEGGCLGIIAFHSLEDRIVKHKFRALAKARELELLFKKPLRPSDNECARNTRSRSARFRAVKRV